jgi:PAS domain S-box-containing protein
MIPKNLRPLFTLFLFFSLSLLTLVILYQQTQIDSFNKQGDQADQERAMLIGGTIRRAIEQNPKLRNDPYTLHLLAEEVGVKQIQLIEENGRLLVDSNREIAPHETVPLSLSLHRASEGKEAILVLPGKKSDRQKMELFLPFQEGNRITVIHLLLEQPLPPKNPNTKILLLLIQLFVGVGGGTLGYYLLRPFWSPSASSNDNEGIRIEAAMHDAVHKLKQMKEAAQADASTMKNYNENIIQSMPSGLITFSCNGQIVTVNPAAEAILGIARENVLEKGYEALFISNDTVATLLGDAFVQKRETTRTECELIRQDGKKIWLGITLSMLLNEAGARIGSSLFLVDITEQRTVQEQSELNKRLAMMGEISGWIAHEFRNYMGTIMGYTSLLSKEFERATPQYEMTRVIADELATMERLITDLLAYGKRPSLTLQRVPFTSLVEEVLIFFKAGSPGIRFSTAFEACEAAIDPVLMRQAVSNLIRNGIEAMKETNKESVLGVRIGYLADGSIEMKISDTGRGIASDQLDKIFLPFFTTREKGSGLGLALVQKIVLSHRGTVSVESKEWEGTTFTITLPRI